MNVEQLPAFVLSVIVLWWSPTVAAFFGGIKPWKLSGLRNDAFTWARMLVSFFRIKVVKYGNTTICKERCLFLSNHRSWADFFLDAYLSEGRAMLLSRWMVAAAFPCIVSSVNIIKGILLFKRGKIADKEAFNNFLDAKIDESPMASLLIFPEGTRNIGKDSLPLRRGMLYYAHSRKLPVQIIISTNKEQVLNEKKMTVGFGTTVVTGHSEVIQSGEYDDFEVFFKKVTSTWADTWANVYGANPAELPEFQPDYPLYDYPMATIRVPHLIKEIIGVVVFLWCIKFCLGLLALAFAAKYGKMLVQHQQGRARGQAGGSGVSSSSHAAANGLSDKTE